MARKKTPRSSTSSEEQQIIRVVQAYRREAEDARRQRLALNRRNWNVYYGNIDWSHKQAGQSTEHLPKMANAAEQTSAFVKKGLTQFGDWFSVNAPHGSILTPEQIRALMLRYLDKLVVARNKTGNIASQLALAVKQGLLESMPVLKVHGYRMKEREFVFEAGDMLAGLEPRLADKEYDYWRLRVDLVATEDYYPDPTGRNLYEIHRVERDLADVWNAAEAGVYDKAVISKVADDMEKEAETRRRAATRNQGEATPPEFRKRVVIEECWGTLLGVDGRPEHENVVTAIINDKYVCRAPEPNPFWHRESPFIAAPILANPHSVWSKAMFDDVVGLNLALDELYNLILDGGIASVWGVRTLREHLLADPRQVSGGVPQGTTLIVSEDAPLDAKVMERVDTGTVPAEAMAIFNLTTQEHNSAAMTNDLRLGGLPNKQVLATEVMSSDQSSAALVDSFVGDLENNIISPLLRKAWFVILQNADDLPSEDVVDAIGVDAAFKLSRMHPAERYTMFAKGCRFVARGLSATLAKARDFQKFLAMLQVTSMNPVLLEAFVRRMSPDKTLDTLMRMLNLNPQEYEQTPEEQAQLATRLSNMQTLNQVAPAKGGGSAAGVAGERSAPNEARADASAGVEAEAGYGST